MATSALRMLSPLAQSLRPDRSNCSEVDALAAWEGWRQALRGEVSADTWRQYVPAVLRFLALSGLVRAPVEAVSRTHVLSFYGEHVPTGYARVAMHAALTSFFRWADLEGLLDRNPMTGVKPRRPREKEPMELTEDELARLLAAVERLRGHRAALSVLLAYLMGLRRKEVVGLAWAEIMQRDNGWVARLTVTKGGDPREIPLSPDAAAVCAELRRLPQRYGRASREAFVVGVTCGTFSEWVHEAAVLAGIPREKAHSHILRASFATHALRRGGDVHVVQRLLGHAKLTTTARYLAVAGEDRRRTVELLHAPAGWMQNPTKEVSL